jgi:hypothetical protein
MAALHLRRPGRRAASCAAASLRLPARFVAVALFALALAGCAAGLAAPSVQHIAMPPSTRGLLTAAVKPDCTFHEIGLGDTVSDAAETASRKLAYERSCYQRAEMQVRARLRRLQRAVAAGMKPAVGAHCGFSRWWRANEPGAWNRVTWLRTDADR